MKRGNKVYWVIFGLCLIIMILAMLNETNIFYIVKNFIFSPEYRENFTLAESDVKTNISLFVVIKQVMTNYRWQFDYLLIFGTNFFQILLPCIVSISGILFYKKFHSIYQYTIYRNANYKKYLLQEIMKESLKMASAFFMSFIIYYIMRLIISKGAMSPYMERSLFLDILGNQFYYNYKYLYYILDGLTRFFLIPFIYSFFSCSLAIVLPTQKQVLFASNIYYYGLSMMGFALQYLFGDYAIYINPSVIMASGSYNHVNTILLFVIHLIPIVISLFIIKRKSRYVEI